jgi:hypothetical protein
MLAKQATISDHCQNKKAILSAKTEKVNQIINEEDIYIF